jgi:hypothetical protein
MKNQGLAAQASGEFTKPMAALLGLTSLAVAGLAWWLVWQALPREATWAQLALPVLLVGAVSGWFQILSLMLKVYQGARVDRPTGQGPRA